MQNANNIYVLYYLRFLARRLKKYEKETILNIDALIPITPVDESTFLELGFNKQVNTLPVSLDINEYHFDPNEKTVYPLNSLDINGDHWLTYSIDFQNTGTAPADNIYITDTLDANLDLATFTLTGYSNQPFVQVINNVAKFNFPNINLPDSLSNEPGSHGYVQYKIKSKPRILSPGFKQAA